jgi:hypothetical protein
VNCKVKTQMQSVQRLSPPAGSQETLGRSWKLY